MPESFCSWSRRCRRWRRFPPAHSPNLPRRSCPSPTRCSRIRRRATGCCGAARSTAGATARSTRSTRTTSASCAWSGRAPLGAGNQEGTPLAYGGVLYMPNPSDVIQAIDAVTGDLRWEYRRALPDDVDEYVAGSSTNRNIAIHGTHVIDTSGDGFVYALDAVTGRLAWETRMLDYTVNPARHSSGPIVAGGKAISGRSCRPQGGPEACVITAHDAATGAEVWRRRLVPAPGEPGDETWGGVPYEERVHVGSWMAPSYDPELNLVYVGDVGHVPGAEVPAGRRREHAPLSQLDAGARRRHGRDRLVLDEIQKNSNKNGLSWGCTVSHIPRSGPRDDLGPKPSITVQNGRAGRVHQLPDPPLARGRAALRRDRRGRHPGLVRTREARDDHDRCAARVGPSIARPSNGCDGTEDE